MFGELQSQKDFINNLSEVAKSIVNEDPSKRRETMEKLKSIAELWKKVNKVAIDKKEEILKSIKEQEEFQEDFITYMSKLQGVSETLSDETDLEQLGNKVEMVLQAGQNILGQATESQKPMIIEKIQSLRDSWSGVQQLKEHASAVQVQIQVTEEKAKEIRKQSEAYSMELNEFNRWLDNAEVVLTTDMYTVPEDKQMDEIHKHEQLYTELQQNTLVVNDLMEKGRRISSNVPDGAREQIRNDLESLSVRWRNIKKLSDAYGSQMENCIAEQASYYHELEKCVEWMQEAGAAIAMYDPDNNDEEAIRKELQSHLDLCDEIRNHQASILSVLEKGNQLVLKLPPGESNVVKEQLTRLEEEWIKLQEQANEKKKELKECLGETEEDSRQLALDTTDVEKIKSDLSNRLLWIQSVMKSADNGKGNNARIAVNSDKDDIEALIKKAEEACDKLNGSERDSLREELDKVKKDWLALTSTTEGRKRRHGRQGSEFESKKMMFDVQFTQLQKRINELQSEPVQQLSSLESKHLQEVRSDIAEVKKELAEGKEKLGKLVELNGELIVLYESEDLNETSIESNEDLLNGLGKQLDDLVLLYDSKQHEVELVCQVNNDLNALDSQITSTKEQFNEITSADDEPEKEILNLEALLRDVELCESKLASVDNTSKKYSEKPGDIGHSLSSRNFDIFEKIQNIKSEINVAIDECRISMSENAVLDEELNRCRDLINQAEAETKKEILEMEIPVVEQQVEQVQGALVSSENATFSLFQKSESMLEKLKPSQKKVKQEQLNQLQMALDDVKEKVRENTETFHTKVKGNEKYVKQYNECAEWLENKEKDLASILQDDNVSLNEKLSNLKEISKELSEETSPLNVLENEAPNLMSALSNTEKQKIRSEINELCEKSKKMKDNILTELEAVNTKSNELSALGDKLGEMSEWLQTKNVESKMIMNDIKHDSLPQSLKEMRIIESEVQSRQEDLDKVNVKNDETLKARLLSLKDSFESAKRNVNERCNILKEQSDAIREFDEQISQCRLVISNLEQLSSGEIPIFEDVEELQQYLDERIKNFSDIVQQGDCIANVEVTKTAIDSSGMKVLKEYAHDQQQEVIEKWESLQVQFTEKILEIRTNLASQQELSSSFSEVSSWIESTEEELSSMKQCVEKVEDMSDSLIKLQSLNKETLSYENFVESLKHKVGATAVDLNSSFKESNENEITKLHDRISSLQDEISSKLNEVKHCLQSVQDATNHVNECKEWLHVNKDLLVDNPPELLNEEDARKNLDQCRDMNSEISSLINKLNQGKEQMKKEFENVSPVLRESLMGDLENMNESLVDLEKQLSIRISEIEGRILRNKEVDHSLSILEQWIDKSEHCCSANLKEPPAIVLEQCMVVQQETPLKENQLQMIERGDSLYQQQISKISGLQKRLTDLSVCLPKIIESCREKVEELDKQHQKLESCSQWVDQATELLNCELPVNFDENSDTVEEDQARKLEKLKAELPIYEDMINSVLISESLQVLKKDNDVSNKLANVQAQIQKTKENVEKSEERLAQFRKSKTQYSNQLQKCQNLLVRAKCADDIKFSLTPSVAESNLEEQRCRVKNIRAMESEIEVLDQAKQRLYGDQYRSQNDTIESQVSSLRDEWRTTKTDALQKQDQLEIWYNQVKEIADKVKDCSDKINTVENAIANASDDKDLASTNQALGSLNNALIQIENANVILESLIEAKESLMSRLSKDEQGAYCDKLKELESHYQNVNDRVKDQISKAEGRIHDFVKFNEDSAYCESMLTIYKEAVPADLTCTVETLDDQIEKLKRLEADMEERESHMIAFKEHASKLTNDEVDSDESQPSKRANQLLDEWTALRDQLNVKRKELDRLSEATNVFQHEYVECVSRLEALEGSLEDEVHGTVNDRMNQVKEILSKFESYENDLNALSDRCRVTPAVAYEQEGDPLTKFNILKNRWQSSKDKVTERLDVLEKEKMDKENIGKEMGNIDNWINQIQLSNEAAPTFDAAEDPFETSLLETMSLECALDEKALEIDRLQVKVNEMMNDDSQKKIDLETLKDLSKKLEEERAATKKKIEVIHDHIQQFNQAEEDIEKCRFVISDTNNLLSTDVMIDDEGLVEKIDSFQENLTKLESWNSHLKSTKNAVERVKELCAISDELNIESDLKKVQNQADNAQVLLKEKIHQLEEISALESECKEHLAFCQDMRSELLSRETSETDFDLAAAKDRLEYCHSLGLKVDETEKGYLDILSKGNEILSDLPSESKLFMQERVAKVESMRNGLKQALEAECKDLQATVAREQSIDEWLDDANALIETCSDLTMKSSLHTLKDHKSSLTSKIGEFQVMIAKLIDQQAVGENLLQTASSPTVSKAIGDISRIQSQLIEAEDKLKQMQQFCNKFDEMKESMVGHLDEGEGLQLSVPSTLEEAEIQIADIKVSSYAVIILSFTF